MNATPSPPLTDVPERIAQVIYLLCQIVTERAGIRVRTLTVAQVDCICRPLLAARKRFRRVVDLIRAGKPPKVRTRKPRVRPAKPKRPTLAELARDLGAMPRGWRVSARRDRALARAAAKAAREAAAAGKPVPMWRALRMHVAGWLYGCAPAIYDCRGSAAACADTLRKYLAEPEMQALLRSNRTVGDSLSKVIHALNIERSLIYPEPVVSATAAEAKPEVSGETPAEIVPATAPAAPPVAPANKTQFRPAAKRPPPSAERAMPPSRAAPGKGVVIIDYWDLMRG